jgi:hypothetical protein
MESQDQNSLTDFPFHRRRKWILFPFFAIVALFVFSGVVMLLWNAILPALFNVGVISYWQAFGLLLLCKILFGCGHRHGWWHHRRHHWADRQFLHERWMSLSDEERAKVREEWRSRCGWGGSAARQP